MNVTIVEVPGVAQVIHSLVLNHDFSWRAHRLPRNQDKNFFLCHPQGTQISANLVQSFNEER